MGKLHITYTDEYGLETYTFKFPDIEESLEKVAVLAEVAEAFQTKLNNLYEEEL